MRRHPQHTSTQPLWDGRAIPKPQRVKLLGKLAQTPQPYPLAPEPALDARRRTSPFLLQRFQVPVPMAVILSFPRGNMPHTPYLPLAVVRTHQHAQQLADVQPITLGAPPA